MRVKESDPVGPHGRFQCAVCGGLFDKDWSDEEAIAEYKARFGDEPMAETPLCDDCYRKVISTWIASPNGSAPRCAKDWRSS